MFKNGVLTIDYDTWKAGIGSSPLVGCGDLRNADIFSQRGALLCGFKSVQETTTTDFVRFMRHDQDANKVYMLDDRGRIYFRTSSETYDPSELNSEVGSGEGFELWRGHLFIPDGTTLHVRKPNGTYVNDWQTFAEGTRGVYRLPHVMLIGQDDVVYITDGRYLASIQEQAGETFDPSDSDTYTWNDAALDLPEGYVATTLAEIDTYLIIGTKYAAALNFGNRADVFSWDRTSPSFRIPQRTRGNGVWQMLEDKNAIYSIIDRSTGKLYASNLTSIELARELPRISPDELFLHPDAVEKMNDELLFGIGSRSEGAERCGVYSFRGDAMQLRHTVSAGDGRVEIGSILNLGEDKMLVSWRKTTGSSDTYGVDVVSDIRCTGYATVLESPLFTVGTALVPQPFEQIDINLAKKLATGQGVKVKYREHLDDAWSDIGTFDFATYGAVSKINDTAGIGAVSTIQLRIELTAAADSTDSPELLSVSLF